MKFTVEVNFAPARKMQKLNSEMRGKDYIPAVLSFSYWEETDEGMLLGEVLICRSEAAKLAKKNGVTLKEQINYLALHGTRHILGIHHD